jgi:hypothetical protein
MRIIEYEDMFTVRGKSCQMKLISNLQVVYNNMRRRILSSSGSGLYLANVTQWVLFYSANYDVTVIVASERHQEMAVFLPQI